MTYTVLAYFDKDVEKFNPAMFFPMQSEFAIENIKDAVIKGKIEGAEAFDLYLLGSYDTANGLFNLNEKPVKVATLSDYVKESA